MMERYLKKSARGRGGQTLTATVTLTSFANSTKEGIWPLFSLTLEHDSETEPHIIHALSA